LQAFGNGQLDAAAADVVCRHIDECQDCLLKVSGVSSDAFLDALRRARSSESLAATRTMPAQAQSCPKVADEFLLARAHCGLGELDEARRYLRTAKERMEKNLPAWGSEDLGDEWHSLVLCKRLCDEAEELLNGPAPATQRR